MVAALTVLRSAFLSTPSARRATLVILRRFSAASNFYPRPPRGGRRPLSRSGSRLFLISIHALREEGDWSYAGFLVPGQIISIHALREEGDADVPCTRGTDAGISIHALREEGDLIMPGTDSSLYVFLSTPSARRATAKTERKPSAFVSLYTSLHKLQRDACKPNRKITPLLAQTAGIPVRSVPENHVCCRFALAGHQKISTLSWANSGCSPTCSTFVW